MAVALPGSKATSRAKGSHRKLGGLGSGRSGAAVAGPARGGEQPERMRHGPEKQDRGIIAMEAANKAEQSVAEPVERRAGTKGNADQQRTRRTQSRSSVSPALERIRKSAERFAVNTRGGSR